MATTEAQSLLTAEQFALLPEPLGPVELVRGRVVEMNRPFPRHGQVCNEAGFILTSFARANDLGHVVTNDFGVVSERNPDSVRGPDVAYFSYARVPKGRLPNRYLDISPEIVVEVRSPDDRWAKLFAKAYEYLNAGVSVVCILDPDDDSIHVLRPDQPPVRLGPNDELTLPEMHGSFHVPVRQFFG